MKRIAILSDKFPPLPCGGIASAHFNLYKMFRSKGYDVHVYTYLDEHKNLTNLKDDPNVHRFGATEFELKYFNLENKIKRKISNLLINRLPQKGLVYQLDLVKISNIGAKKINKHLKKFKPDIVFIPDFGVPGYSINKLSNIKYVHISHNNPVRFINNPLIGIHSENDTLTALKYEQQSLKLIDKVICPSNYMKEVFSKTFSFDKDIVVIPNLIHQEYINNIKKEDLHEILGINPSWPIIYIPSAGSKYKGEKFVIEIIRRISNNLNNEVGFYLSGNLSENQIFELSFLPDYHIYSPGYVSLESNIANIKDCKICISPTLFECFGMAILEALFCGLPCVAFNVGGNKEIIDCNNGFLVQFLDIETLISRSLELLNSSDLFYSLAKNTKNTQKEYSSDIIYERYYEIINGL